MTFSNSISKINNIKIEKDLQLKNNTLFNKICSNCEYFHEPMRHCDYLYKSVNKNDTCSSFLKIII